MLNEINQLHYGTWKLQLYNFFISQLNPLKIRDSKAPHNTLMCLVISRRVKITWRAYQASKGYFVCYYISLECRMGLFFPLRVCVNFAYMLQRHLAP